MKIGCISWSHRNEVASGALDLCSWIEHCKKDAGLDGVELWNNHFESLEETYLEKVKATAAKMELEIYSVATKCLFGAFTAEEIAKAQQTLRDWLAAADYLGAPLLRVSVGGNELREPAHQLAIFDALTAVVRENKFPHIGVGIENQEPGAVQNAEDVALMVARSAGDLKLILDNGSLLNKNDSYAFTEKTIASAGVVHVKFFELAEDGSDKLLDYKRIAEIIKKSGYDGYLSIEYESSEPAIWDVPRIARYLRTLF